MGGVQAGIDWRNAAIIVAMAAALAVQYFVTVDLTDPSYSMELHDRVLDGDASSPYLYRVLVPHLVEPLAQTFAATEDRVSAFLRAFAVYDVLALTAQLLALYLLFRQWFSPRHSMVGIAFIAGVTPISFTYFAYQPWSLLEVAFISLGLVCAHRRRWVLFLVCVLLASLNRETGIFLPVAVVLTRLPEARVVLARFPSVPSMLRSLQERRELIVALSGVVLSTLVFAGLRLLRGGADPADELLDVIVRNLASENLWRACAAMVLFLGAGWIFVVRGWLRAPSFLRYPGLTAILYLAVFAVWGWWQEVRLLTTLYPFLVPLLLWYLYREDTRSKESATDRSPQAANGRSVERTSRSR